MGAQRNNIVFTTLPITETKFPKVTVCPPKNTFTNLNYDLKMTAEGIFLDNYIKDDLIFYATELVQDHHYQEFMIN